MGRRVSPQFIPLINQWGRTLVRKTFPLFSQYFPRCLSFSFVHALSFSLFLSLSLSYIVFKLIEHTFTHKLLTDRNFMGNFFILLSCLSLYKIIGYYIYYKVMIFTNITPQIHGIVVRFIGHSIGKQFLYLFMSNFYNGYTVNNNNSMGCFVLVF